MLSALLLFLIEEQQSVEKVEMLTDTRTFEFPYCFDKCVNAQSMNNISVKRGQHTIRVVGQGLRRDKACQCCPSLRRNCSYFTGII